MFLLSLLLSLSTINVTDYGADPTGGRDSAPAFNAAMLLGRTVTCAGVYRLDSPVVMATPNNALHGPGCVLAPTSPSAVGVLILASHVTLSGVSVWGTGAREAAWATAIQVGSPETNPTDTHFFDVQVGSVGIGIHFVSGQRFVISGGSYIQGLWALFVENRANADAGDSFISDSTLTGQPTRPDIGGAIYWISSGGLKITNTKFLYGYQHICIDMVQGHTGNFNLSNSSLEGDTYISIYITGDKGFERLAFTGNSWGVGGTVLYVQDGANIQSLAFTGNVVSACLSKCHSTPNALLDLGGVNGVAVTGNVMTANGYPGFVGVRARSTATNVLVKSNVITGVQVPVQGVVLP